MFGPELAGFLLSELYSSDVCGRYAIRYDYNRSKLTQGMRSGRRCIKKSNIRNKHLHGAVLDFDNGKKPTNITIKKTS